MSGSKVRLAAFCVGLLAIGSAEADTLDDALTAIKSVGPRGVNHQAAQRAWPVAARAPIADLPRILAALDDANPLAANWLRSAAEAVAQGAAARGDKSAAPLLERFVDETSHRPSARRLAYELLLSFDPAAEQRLLAGFLDDPSTELRREAVAAVVAVADATTDDERKKSELRRAFHASRDLDQVKEIVAALKKMSVEVDLATHLGFITRWKLVGPFDNAGEKGFDVAYPPESGVRLDAEYVGKDGKKIAWIDFTTTDPYGEVDLNKALGKHKGAAAYAFAEFHATAAGTAEFRLGSISAVKLWLNGRLLDERKVYHSGSEVDQYISRGELQAGTNRILLKVCENEQTESWAQDWKFQLRVCDAVGTPIPSQGRVAADSNVKAE